MIDGRSDRGSSRRGHRAQASRTATAAVRCVAIRSRLVKSLQSSVVTLPGRRRLRTMARRWGIDLGEKDCNKQCSMTTTMQKRHDNEKDAIAGRTATSSEAWLAPTKYRGADQRSSNQEFQLHLPGSLLPASSTQHLHHSARHTSQLRHSYGAALAALGKEPTAGLVIGKKHHAHLGSG